MKYLKLFLTFMKIGFVGFGGGMAILPLIYQGVSKFIYISQEDFADLFGISQATPGPIAINAATFVGYKVGGVLGSLVATLGVVLPSFLLVLLTTSFLKKHREHPLVEGAFAGIRPVTVGMIASGVVYIASGAIFNADVSALTGLGEVLGAVDPIACIMALIAAVLVYTKKLGAIQLIIGMGVLGAFIFS
ncbi:MAG: chromate transporter [Firmicutes bacterium]|nr:chromate transporter [Bacillota bacterium]